MRHFILFVSVQLWLAFFSVRARLASALAASLGAVALPAQGDDGIFEMLDGVADGADKSGESLLKLAKFGGIGLVIAGVMLWVAKKKNPQISWGWVLTALGAGFILIAIDQFIKKGQSTIQLSPVDVG